MTADLDFGTTGDHTTPPHHGPSVRSPAMRAYCATLARFTSSVQSTEQLLRNDDAGTREDSEQRELTAATRLRGIDRAGAAADDGLAHCAAVRDEYGLPAGSALHRLPVDAPDALADHLPSDTNRRADHAASGGLAGRLPGDTGRRHGPPGGPGQGPPDRPGDQFGGDAAVYGTLASTNRRADHNTPSGPVDRFGGDAALDGTPGSTGRRAHHDAPDDLADRLPGGTTVPPRGLSGHHPVEAAAEGPDHPIGHLPGRIGRGPSAVGRPGAGPAGAATPPDPGSAGRATAVRSDPRGLRSSEGRPDDTAPGLDRLRRTGGADLGVALTALGRRRDELKLAEAEFADWLRAHDERSRRVTLGAVVAAGLAGAAVMAVAGTRTSAAVALALLIVCTLAVVAVGLGVAAARRLPRVCRGAGLARRPDAWALAKYGARIGGAALLALTAANVAAGAL